MLQSGNPRIWFEAKKHKVDKAGGRLALLWPSTKYSHRSAQNFHVKRLAQQYYLLLPSDVYRVATTALSINFRRTYCLVRVHPCFCHLKAGKYHLLSHLAVYWLISHTDYSVIDSDYLKFPHTVPSFKFVHSLQSRGEHYGHEPMIILSHYDQRSTDVINKKEWFRINPRLARETQVWTKPKRSPNSPTMRLAHCRKNETMPQAPWQIAGYEVHAAFAHL